jgi:hypothetical protein
MIKKFYDLKSSAGEQPVGEGVRHGVEPVDRNLWLDFELKRPPRRSVGRGAILKRRNCLGNNRTRDLLFWRQTR